MALLLAMMLAMMLGFGQAAQAANITFDGNAKKVPNNCTLATGTVYTCTASPMTSDNDTMTIANGITVNVRTSLTLTYNQGLVMSGTAQLNVTGDLDIGGMNGPNLKVSGGSLIASGKFTVGWVNQTLTADITAGSIAMGSGSVLNITGNIFASGAIDIASNFTLTGTLTGGTIVTSAGVNLGGNVKATTAFTLASGSKVNGTIDAPVTRLLAAGSTVNGGITAKTSLFVGASNTVNGDVVTGALTTQASSATINGNATVDSAVLEWQARVVKTIYCTGGTRTGYCDCVTNNSGWPSTVAEGPHCSTAKTVAPALHHFLITHDGTASACTAEPVTVTACADASCGTLYTGGVSGTLAPGGASFKVDSTGRAVQSSVSMSNTGTAALAVASSTVAPTNDLACSNTGTTTTGCNMRFDGNVGMTLTFPDQVSDTVTAGTLTTNAFDASNQRCGPGFVNVAKPVTFACKYANPATGTLPVRISADGGATFVALNNGTDAFCSSAGRSVSVQFGATGTADLKMQYADVGRVRIDATTSNGSASVTTYDQVISAPASYQFATWPATVISGEQFQVTVKVLNASGNLTPNFGKEAADGASHVESLTFGANTPCVGGIYVPKTDPFLTVHGNTASGGVVTALLRYPEAGKFNAAARQKNDNYLSGTVANTDWVYPGAATNCGLTRAYPAYFEVATGVNRSQAYYYSGQPIDITVTAKNAQGTTTQRYEDASKYSNGVQVSVVDPNPTAPLGTPAPVTAAGKVPGQIAASAFKLGVATIATADSKPAAGQTAAPTPTDPAFTYTFKSIPTVPTKITLRAVETGTTANTVSSANGARYTLVTPAEAQPEIRSGRIRIGNNRGGAAMTLKLPVAFEYFSASKTWIRNTDENIRIPAGAIVIRSAAPSLTTPTNGNQPCCDLQFQQGLASIAVKPAGGTGSAFVVFNLGAGGAAAPDASCILPAASSVGAGLPWLRAPNGICATTPLADPVGRATFGVPAPEIKRSVHAREVFN